MAAHYLGSKSGRRKPQDAFGYWFLVRPRWCRSTPRAATRP